MATVPTRPAAGELHRRQAWQALAFAIAATLAVHWIPWLQPLAWPLLLVSTLAHELGHGLTALLLGGRLHQLQLWSDGSGVAAYSGAFGRVAQASIAAGGLLGPPAAAFALLLAGRHSRPAHVALGVLAVLLLLTALLWAASLFTIAVCLVSALLLGLLAWRGSPRISQIVCVFVAVQLALAAFSRSDYLFTAVAQTGQGPMLSDVGQIAAALWLPYWFWGAVIALASLLLLALGARLFVRALA